MPLLSPRGIYQIKSEWQYRNFLDANPDKLVVIKYFASYCRACKALEPKFVAVKDDRQLVDLPIVWAEYQSQRKNKDLFQQLNVLALPTVQFYDGDRGVVENFPCGPAKIPLLKQKLAQFLNARVDPDTRQLKPTSEDERQSMLPRVDREVSVSDELITKEHIDYLRHGMPFFEDLSQPEFDELLGKARLLTFEAGDLIIRQGMPPTTFYVLKSGKVEMCIRGKFDDPISTPPNYLGVAVNELKTFDFFGERALTTGEPYACSIRVLQKTRAFAFAVEDIPESSILSKQRRANGELVEKLTERYLLPEDYTPTYQVVTPRDECVLELLVRFKQIRQAAKCFQYIMKSQPNWGDQGEIARRSMLVNKLSKAQADEFQDVFNIVDKDKKGKISLLEMRKFMESARENKSTDELMEMLARANPKFDENKDYAISRDEFMGVMAEAEFYNLFTETFTELDLDQTGYVRAGDLDDVLGGVRDLISNDKTNIIDVEDKDMLIDYEQFSKMLLGAAL
ncbi:Thioredoxin-like 2 [Seminavis robusta]|uniref:Thioredoxin-like 2 n=1 Tax=Seminavis robusta TaxID=568900 RepID=A0A9N8E2B0_9STRA|nr:Thioredoxin-like 2 [Seminavis robusta]|eukprot:Sro577_g169690.1 Thioredoxin-like 2 (510) ;mRNA; f:26772-28399